MMYRYTLFLCFLSSTVIGDPFLEIIGNSSSTSCGNFTSLGGNFQSVTFKVTGDWGNSALDVFNTPYLRYANDSSICALVNQQDKCAVQSNLHYTCTCENKTGGLYHLTFTSSPSYPLVSYAVYLTWANGPQKATSGYFVVEEVKNESCACEVHVVCVALISTGFGMALCVLAVKLYFSCKKTEFETRECETTECEVTMIWISVLGIGLSCAVIVGLVSCFKVVKNCQTNSETIFTWVMLPIVCVVLIIYIILLIVTRCHKTKVFCNVSFISCNMVHIESTRNQCEEMENKSDQTNQSNNSKSQISLLIVVEEQEFVNSLPAGGTGTRTKENGKKKKASKKIETGDKNKGETSSPKPVKQASIKEGAVGRRGTEDNVEIPLTPLESENQVSNSQGVAGSKGTSGISDTSSTTSPESESQVSNDQGAAKSAGTDVVRNERASGDKNSDRPSTTPPESQGKMEGKKALENEANKNRRNSVPTKLSENQGTNVPENTKKLAWNEHTEKVQKASERKQTGNKDDPQRKNKAQSSSSGSKSRPPP